MAGGAAPCPPGHIPWQCWEHRAVAARSWRCSQRRTRAVVVAGARILRGGLLGAAVGSAQAGAWIGQRRRRGGAGQLAVRCSGSAREEWGMGCAMAAEQQQQRLGPGASGRSWVPARRRGPLARPQGYSHAAGRIRGQGGGILRDAAAAAVVQGCGGHPPPGDRSSRSAIGGSGGGRGSTLLSRGQRTSRA